MTHEISTEAAISAIAIYLAKSKKTRDVRAIVSVLRECEAENVLQVYRKLVAAGEIKA